MLERNSYIVSLALHLAAIGLVLMLATRPATQIRSLQRYQPVRLVAPQGRPGPSLGQTKVEPAKPPVQTKTEPKAKPLPKAKESEKQQISTKGQERTKKTGEAAPQTGTKGSTPGTGGVDNLRLDGANFPYPYYLSNIQIKILSNFKPVISAKEAEGLKSIVFFIINRNGNISDVKLESKSGHFLFDQEAQRAVLRSNPLPALPPAFGSDRLGVHFEFVASQ